MWKNYSADYIRNNRASGYSIMAAAFIAALFLSFLCSLFYNFWLDNIEGTIQEDGDWQGRITGELGGDALEKVSSFANVEKAVVNTGLSDGNQTVVDIYFGNKRTIYQDMSLMINTLGLSESAAAYNYQLLSLYFIRIPGDDKPRLLLPMYLGVVLLVCFSLILVIYNSFAVSQNHRIHQFGIFSSIGATPGQIRICLVQEALALSSVPILLGTLLGIALSFGTVRIMNAFTANLAGGRQRPFECHVIILVVILLLSVFTVLISAWIPAGKLSRLTPLEAIRGTGELQMKRKRLKIWHFGIEWELAGNALWAQRKALRTTSLSLTLAFLGFMLMQCFWTLSAISTNHTYFEAYQDAWDIMVTLKDTSVEDFALTQELKDLPGTQSVVLYQEAKAMCALPDNLQSQELLELGGLEAFAGETARSGEDILLAETQIVILDDGSFGEYCRQAGMDARFDGAVILNRIWDSKNSNFRYPAYIPYIKEETDRLIIQNTAGYGEMMEIPVLACVEEAPLLREDYGKSDHMLVQFIPVSLWEKISGQTGGAEKDSYIRILAEDRSSLDALRVLENEVTQIVGSRYGIESENRIQEKIDNDKMVRGYELVLGAFCVLLAIIGIAHVFSNTMGFLRQRKREFARLQSVGLTPEGIRKMFCIEAIAITGRPVLVTLSLTIVAVALMIRASYLEPMEFIRVAPVMPILAFILTVFGFVALAYYLGGKKILEVSLSEALRDDTMM